MANTDLPSSSVLRQLIAYDEHTGLMTWNERGPEWFADDRLSAKGRANCWNGKNAGREAFSHRNATGYRYARILGQLIMGYRVAFCIAHGRWPEGEIDHINGKRDDNRIANLREATRSLNCRNRRWAKGYHFEFGRPKPWRVFIGVGGKQVSLGSYATEPEAVAARLAGEKLYGYPSAQ